MQFQEALQGGPTAACPWDAPWPMPIPVPAGLPKTTGTQNQQRGSSHTRPLFRGGVVAVLANS